MIKPDEIRTEGMKALGVLRVAGVSKDTETITIGPHVMEVDTRTASHVTAGRIRLNLSGGSTVKAQATLTMDTQPTAGDTVVIGGNTWTWVASGAGENQISRGAGKAAGSGQLCRRHQRRGRAHGKRGVYCRRLR